MKRNKIIKIVIWSLISIAALWGIYAKFIKTPDPIITFQLETVQTESLYYEVSATGTIAPVESVDIGTQISGQISKVYVKSNDTVRKGQVLAKMDTRNLYISLKESKANYEKAKLALDQAERSLKLEKKLYDQGASFEQALNQAQDAYDNALITLNMAKIQKEKNELNIGYAQIESPIDGIVIAVNAKEGQTVTATFTSPNLFSVAKDLSKMKIEASVDEADIGKVKTGQPVSFTVDAYPEESFSGVVETIEIQPVVSQGVVTYTTVVLIDNPGLKLLPGMTATLLIRTNEYPKSMTVPNAALSFNPDELDWQTMKKSGYSKQALESNPERSLWILKGKKLIELPVQVEYTNGIRTAITAEVGPQDSIITYCKVQLEEEKEGLFSRDRSNNE